MGHTQLRRAIDNAILKHGVSSNASEEIEQVLLAAIDRATPEKTGEVSGHDESFYYATGFTTGVNKFRKNLVREITGEG